MTLYEKAYAKIQLIWDTMTQNNPHIPQSVVLEEFRLYAQEELAAPLAPIWADFVAAKQKEQDNLSADFMRFVDALEKRQPPTL